MMGFIIGFISGAVAVASIVLVNNLLERIVFHEGNE